MRRREPDAPELAPERVAFGTGSGPVVVAVGVAGAFAVVDALFPDDREADPGGPPDLVLQPGPAGGAVLTAPRGRWTSPDPAPLLVQLELSLAEELVLRSGLPGLHAGGVVLGGRAVLFPGEGGTGKSSLTAALAARGVPVLGDDVVLLDPDGWAHPFRRLLKVEEPARTLLGLPAPDGPLARAWPGAGFYRPRQLGSRWADPAPVGAVVLPVREAGAAAALEPLRPARVLPGLLAGLVLSPRVEGPAFETVAASLASAACWELRYSATAEAADALLAALG